MSFMRLNDKPSKELRYVWPTLWQSDSKQGTRLDGAETQARDETTYKNTVLSSILTNTKDILVVLTVWLIVAIPSQTLIWTKNIYHI